MLKEEVIDIKECLNQDEFEHFTVVNMWLEKCKLSYNLRERRVNREVIEAPEYTISDLIEKQEITNLLIAGIWT